MKKIYIFTLLISLSFCSLIIAQNSNDLITNANSEFDRFAYIDAREIYIQVANKGYKSADLYQKIADSYYFNAEFREAHTWYDKLVKQFSASISPEYLYRYAQCLKSVQKFKKADKVMERFASITKEYDSRAFNFKTNRYYLDLIEKRSGKFQFNPFDFNSEFSDHSPSFSTNGDLIFASSRGGGEISVWDKMPFLDLYNINLEQGTLNNDIHIKPLKGDINTPVHESSAAITKDGKTMYFTRNNYLKKQLNSSGSGTVMLKLYQAELVNKKWTNIKELPFNSDDYSTAHPALSPNEDKLYFASDMPGSYGNSDLYVVTINEDKSFGKPKNLGYNINTEGRETFPFVSNDGNLYFSSDGHLGLGGLDVFISKVARNTYANPYNIGKPINGPSDDFSFIIDKKTDIGFFASNRVDGQGSDDIYSFKQMAPLDINCQLFIEGIVTNQKTNEVIPDALVKLYDKDMNLTNQVTTDKNGYYTFAADCNSSFNLNVYKVGYRSQRTPLKTSKYKGDVVKQNFDLSNDSFKSRIARIGDDLAKILQLNTIYFNYNDYEIRKDAELELQKIIAVLQSNDHIKIEIRSHTDSRANDEYNYDLSKLRAKATKEYLVNSGDINRNRIFYKGYGETQLVNNCANDVDCSDFEHAKNRRSEFIILNSGIINTAASDN
ncbi:OmpA family protein [Aquimarina agarilytica]|uniref:OmpA family protein n=1 Tax=Aquimarina agarilytica TaxID=1087449 RepID=UPI00028A2DE8|nr:OmpA family protein [Aquimarina agarilytica]